MIYFYYTAYQVKNQPETIVIYFTNKTYTIKYDSTGIYLTYHTKKFITINPDPVKKTANYKLGRRNS